jgi:multidrug resistance efflux pump
MTSARRFIAPLTVLSTLLTCALYLALSPFDATAAGKSRQGQEGGKSKIEQLKKLKLIEKLDLDDATAEKFFMRYNGSQKKVEESRKALDDATNELDKAKAGGNTEKIKQLTEQMLQKHKQLQEATNEMLKSIRIVLNDKQYAEFLVFEAKFPEILRKSLQDRKDSVRK